jgi:hypothetical protein
VEQPLGIRLRQSWNIVLPRRDAYRGKYCDPTAIVSAPWSYPSGCCHIGIECAASDHCMARS